MKTIRLSLTEEDLRTIAHILDHFSDYMFLDDRPDHGFGILKGYRTLPDEQRQRVITSIVKVLRAKNRMIFRQMKTAPVTFKTYM